MTPATIGAAVLMLIGTAGIVVPVLPGLVLVWLGTLLWATEVGSSTGWAVCGVAFVILVAGMALQLHVPNKRLKAADVPQSTQFLALLVGLVLMIPMPLVGLPIGFVGTTYAVERVRTGTHGAAVASTKTAVRALVVSKGIELATALAIIATWLVGLYLIRSA